MLGHRHPPVGITPIASGPSHSSAAAATVSKWAAPAGGSGNQNHRDTSKSTSPV
jgi:hypothetical protein